MKPNNSFFLVSIAMLLITFSARASGDSVNPVPIRIAYPPTGTVISAQVGLTLEKTDILKRNALAGELYGMSNGRDMKLSLVSDKVDVILTSEANFVVLLAEGFEAYGIASLGAGGNMALAVKSGAGITELAQLKGRKLGTIFGTSLHRPSLDWTQGVSGLEIVSMPTIGALGAALDSDNISAAMLWDPHVTDLLDKGKIRVLKQEPLELIAIASKKFISRYPDALERLQNALKDAVFHFVTHKEVVNRWYGDVSKIEMKLIDHISSTNRNYGKTRRSEIDIAISPEFVSKMQATAAFLHENKVISRIPELGSAIKNPPKKP